MIDVGGMGCVEYKNIDFSCHSCLPDAGRGLDLDHWKALGNASDVRCSSFQAKLLILGGHSRIRTYDFHRVKVALYR